MRLISIEDNKGRNALVGIRSCSYRQPKKVETEKTVFSYLRQRVIKSTLVTDGKTLLMECNDMHELAEKIRDGDPEIDLQLEGMFPGKMHQIYVDDNNRLTNDIHFEEEIYENDGTLREVRPYEKTENNIQNENLPVRWSGLAVPLNEAMHRYVFTHHYQLFHTNGLTFDFLQSMAKELDDKKIMMFAGSGESGTDPIVFSKGGKKYRGFLSGSAGPNSYILLLHLTEIDLEDFIND